jgi:hypothetical protein
VIKIHTNQCVNPSLMANKPFNTHFRSLLTYTDLLLLPLVVVLALGLHIGKRGV